MWGVCQSFLFPCFEAITMKPEPIRRRLSQCVPADGELAPKSGALAERPPGQQEKGPSFFVQLAARPAP